MTKEQEEILRKWAEALRSGEYKQGDGYLRYDTDEGDCLYCCLGVLADMYSKEFGKEWDDSSGNYYYIDCSSLYLPDSVIEWAGLDTNSGFMDGDDEIDFAVMNDDEDMKFPEIANEIEKVINWRKNAQNASV